jgi:hypothetical protein
LRVVNVRRFASHIETGQNGTQTKGGIGGSMARNVIKTLRFSEDEIEQVKYYAERCGLSITVFIRRCALKHKPRGKDLSRLTNEISKQGGLLKHLHTQGLGHGDMTAQVLRDMQKLIKEATRAVMKTTDEEVREKEERE